MKLLCFLKSSRSDSRPIILHESDSLDDLKSRAMEYASTNPSFRANWEPNGGRDRQELKVEFDYRLEIQA
jgi:hypothetical protein